MRSHIGRPWHLFISIKLSSFPESSLPCQLQEADCVMHSRRKPEAQPAGPSWLPCSNHRLQVVLGPLLLPTAHDGTRTPVLLQMGHSRLGYVRTSREACEIAAFKPRNSDIAACGKEPRNLQKGLSSSGCYEAQPNLKSIDLCEIILPSNCAKCC